MIAICTKKKTIKRCRTKQNEGGWKNPFLILLTLWTKRGNRHHQSFRWCGEDSIKLCTEGYDKDEFLQHSGDMTTIITVWLN